MNFYNQDIADVFIHFDTSEKGLNKESVKERLEKYGKNELPKKKAESIFKIFISQFKNPIEMILVITVILSFTAGEIIDAFALILIILVDVLMATYEEVKARKDADSLMNMIRSTSKVIRGNREMVIDSSNVVVGDILILESGDKISADARIIECYNFQVDESSLTGESINVYLSLIHI